MATIEPFRRNKTYEKLKQIFKDLRTTLDPRLEGVSLSEFGIDCSQVDLYHEIEEGGAYFLPLSAARVDRLDLRPDFNVNWDTLCPRFRIPNAMWLQHALLDQLLHSKDESEWSALDTTKWKISGEFTSYEKALHECRSPYVNTNPCRQTEWRLQDRLETPNLPHRICFSLHEIEDVRGLLRSEMTSVVGMMIAKMRRKQFRTTEVTPLLMVSIIGSEARIIQAHMVPGSQQLYVRYSQLFDFRNGENDPKDMFFRWMLSEPLPEPKHPADIMGTSTWPRHHPPSKPASSLLISPRTCGIEQRLALPHTGPSETTRVVAM